MEKQIITNEEGKKYLMKEFSCSRMQVWKALHFRGDSNMQTRIRALALQRGGVLIGAASPECETTFEEEDGTMTQKWGGRVKIVLRRKTGDVKVYVDGDIRRTVKNPDIPVFLKLQKEAELMAQTL